MAKLTTKKRDKLPKASFALQSTKSYPITNESHARNALARVAQHGTPAEKAAVRKKVAEKFPGIAQTKGKVAKAKAKKK